VASGSFTEVPPGATLLLAVIITVPCGIAGADMVKSHNDYVACQTAAAEWAAGNVDGAVYRPSNARYFAKQYNAFRTACPNGHFIVDDSKLPAAVRTGYVPAKK
jgi:hypothetical protein